MNGSLFVVKMQRSVGSGICRLERTVHDSEITVQNVMYKRVCGGFAWRQRYCYMIDGKLYVAKIIHEDTQSDKYYSIACYDLHNANKLHVTINKPHPKLVDLMDDWSAVLLKVKLETAHSNKLTLRLLAPAATCKQWVQALIGLPPLRPIANRLRCSLTSLCDMEQDSIQAQVRARYQKQMDELGEKNEIMMPYDGQGEDTETERMINDDMHECVEERKQAVPDVVAVDCEPRCTSVSPTDDLHAMMMSVTPPTPCSITFPTASPTTPQLHHSQSSSTSIKSVSWSPVQSVTVGGVDTQAQCCTVSSDGGCSSSRTFSTRSPVTTQLKQTQISSGISVASSKYFISGSPFSSEDGGSGGLQTAVSFYTEPGDVLTTGNPISTPASLGKEQSAGVRQQRSTGTAEESCFHLETACSWGPADAAEPSDQSIRSRAPNAAVPSIQTSSYTQHTPHVTFSAPSQRTSPADVISEDKQAIDEIGVETGEQTDGGSEDGLVPVFEPMQHQPIAMPYQQLTQDFKLLWIDDQSDQEANQSVGCPVGLQPTPSLDMPTALCCTAQSTPSPMTHTHWMPHISNRD